MNFRAQVRWFYFSSIAITLTGFIYLWMKYRTKDPSLEFSVLNHPYQGIMLKAHILAAPLFIAVAGSLIFTHFLEKIKGQKTLGRNTGKTLFIMIVLMIISGVLIQVFTEESYLIAVRWIHIVSSSSFVLAFILHRITVFPRKR